MQTSYILTLGDCMCPNLNSYLYANAWQVYISSELMPAMTISGPSRLHRFQCQDPLAKSEQN